MKKILGFFLLIVSITLQSQSSFDSGFKKGFCEGYKDKCGAYSVCPVAPVAPSPSGYQSSDSYTDGYNTGFKKGMNRGQRDCADKGSDGAYANPKGPDSNPQGSTRTSSYTNSNNNTIISSEELITLGVVGGVLLADIIISSVKEKKARKLEEIEYSKNEIKEATKRIEYDPNNEINYFNRAIHKEKLGIYSFNDYDKACNLGHEKSCSNRNIGEFIVKILSDSINEGETNAECVDRHSFVISNKFIEIDPNNSYPYWLRAEAKEKKGYPSFLNDYLKACNLGEKEACKALKKREYIKNHNIIDSVKIFENNENLVCWDIIITPDKKFLIFLCLDLSDNNFFASIYNYGNWTKLKGPFQINKETIQVYTENSSEKIYFVGWKKANVLDVNKLTLQDTELSFKEQGALLKAEGKNFTGRIKLYKQEISIDDYLIICGNEYFTIWKN